jgi:hypothetical protein
MRLAKQNAVFALLLLGLLTLSLLIGWHQVVGTSPLPSLVHGQPPRLLLIIQGGYRTMDLTVDSIVRNLCLVNGGCHIALSLANDAEAVSRDVRLKLEPYLVAEFYREPGDMHSPHYIFEYHQTLKVLTRISLAPYDYVMRIRADCYISVPIPVMSALGLGANFDRDWDAFGRQLPPAIRYEAHARLRAWFFAGAIPQLVSKLVLQTPPPMAWSPLNSLEFNPALLDALNRLPDIDDPIDSRVMRPIVQDLARRLRILYISGGLFLHFGTTADMVLVTQTAYNHWKNGPGTTLSWQSEFPINARVRSWSQPITQEANIRLAHRRAGLALIDLHNAADYLLSFSWKYYGFSQLTRARGLVIWLLRPRQVKFRQVVQLTGTRFWKAIDNVSYPNPTAHSRSPVLTHGCLSESTPAEMADCFQDERDQ